MNQTRDVADDMIGSATEPGEGKGKAGGLPELARMPEGERRQHLQDLEPELAEDLKKRDKEQES